jgi:hypothetical protein
VLQNLKQNIYASRQDVNYSEVSEVEFYVSTLGIVAENFNQYCYELKMWQILDPSDGIGDIYDVSSAGR